MTEAQTVKLFSYGTLQLESVQLSQFGRKLTGKRDVLPCFRLETIMIANPEVVQTSGLAEHFIAVHSGTITDTIAGVVYDISESELLHADAYEVPEYKRVKARLESGTEAWVYVSAAG